MVARSASILVLVALISGCAGTPPAPLGTDTPASSGLTEQASLARGGQKLDAAAIRTAVTGRSCTGETADGLFEIAFAPKGSGTVTAADGSSTTLDWRVDNTDELCWGTAGSPVCESVVLYEGSLRLFDAEGRHAASLVCS